MSNTAIIFNSGGSLEVTPADGSDLSVTLSLGGKSKTFTEAFDTDVATTITNFVASNAQNIADEFGVYVGGTETVLELFTVDGLSVTSVNATVGSLTATTEFFQPINGIGQVLVASASSLTINLIAGEIPAASDVLTVAFVSELDRKKFEDRYREIVRASLRGEGLIKLGIANKTTKA